MVVASELRQQFKQNPFKPLYQKPLYYKDPLVLRGAASTTRTCWYYEDLLVLRGPAGTTRGRWYYEDLLVL